MHRIVSLLGNDYLSLRAFCLLFLLLSFQSLSDIFVSQVCYNFNSHCYLVCWPELQVMFWSYIPM